MNLPTKLNAIVHWFTTSDSVRRVLHTFWQAAGGLLLSGLLAAHSTTDVKMAVGAALAAGLAAVKAAFLAKRN